MKAPSIRDGAIKPTESTGVYSQRVYDINYRHKLANPRICICDNYSIPKDCENGCDEKTKTTCDYHANVKCPTTSCKKYFHKGCIASYKYVDIDSIKSDHLLCMECESEKSGDYVTWEYLKNNQLEEKLERLGIPCPSNPQERKKASLQMNKIVDVLSECYSGYKSFLDNKPQPYPTSFAMSDESKKKAHIAW